MVISLFSLLCVPFPGFQWEGLLSWAPTYPATRRLPT